MLSDEIEKIIIDEEILSRLKSQIITLERLNIKTNERTSQEMIKLIQKTIESSVQ